MVRFTAPGACAMIAPCRTEASTPSHTGASRTPQPRRAAGARRSSRCRPRSARPSPRRSRAVGPSTRSPRSSAPEGAPAGDRRRHAARHHGGRTTRERPARPRRATAAAAVRPAESHISSHFNPTLSHFVPLSVPLCGPNPAESRPIPPNPAPQTLVARVPGCPTSAPFRPDSKGADRCARRSRGLSEQCRSGRAGCRV